MYPFAYEAEGFHPAKALRPIKHSKPSPGAAGHQEWQPASLSKRLRVLASVTQHEGNCQETQGHKANKLFDGPYCLS
jgi:hypothetical protein